MSGATINMNQQPWLDDLSEDWLSLPRSSTGSLPKMKPLKHSSLRSNSYQKSARQAKTIPLKNHKNHSPKLAVSPRLPDSENGDRVLAEQLSSKRNIPGPSHQLPGGKKSLSPFSRTMRNTSRSISIHSSQSVKCYTMHVRPGNQCSAECTPEWRKRILRGDIPVGESCDLFGPLQLENMFKPPQNPETRISATLPTLGQTDPLWSLPTTSGNRIVSSEKDSKGPLAKPIGLEGASSEKISNSNFLGLKGFARDEIGALTSPNQSGSREDFEESQLQVVNEALSDLRLNCDDGSHCDKRLRTASGLEELRNEEISPIFLTRNSIVYELTDCGKLKREFLQSGVSNETCSSLNQQIPASRDSDDGNYSRYHDEFIGPENTFEVTSQSLPGDLSMGTQDFASIGRFVKVRRGGYSNDGSFLQRRLSLSSIPSQLHPSYAVTGSPIRSSPAADMRAESSRGTQKFPPDPTTPSMSPEITGKTQREETISARPRVSGSPLKLFGNHDTFTSNKLLRRMGQFEETFEGSSALSPTEVRQTGGNRSPSNSTHDFEKPHDESNKSGMNKFGIGQLDHFGFAQGMPTLKAMQEGAKESPRFLIASSLVKPTGETSKHSCLSPHLRHLEQSNDQFEKGEVLNSYYESRFPCNEENRQPGQRKDNRNLVQGEQEGGNRTKSMEVKRVLNSPVKDSTPKRRRTLQDAGAQNQTWYEPIINSTKFSSHVASQQNTETHWNPSKRRTPETGRSPAANDNEFSPTRLGMEKYHKDRRHLAADVSQVVEENRKGSITTQDFLDEATKIMSIIRAKGGLKRGLTNVEESDGTSDEDEADEYVDESTQDEFLRPPSREGIDLRKLRAPVEPNPRVVSHLKKFEDKDEFELFMGTSVMSLHLDKDRHSTKRTIIGVQTQSHGDDVVESSPKNIRIRDNPLLRKRKHSSSSVDRDLDSQGRVFTQSHFSSQNSSGKSFPIGSPKGSSGSSGAKGVISCNMIAHLIPEHVGGMIYDRHNHTWVKEKEANPPQTGQSGSNGDMSEDDPFRDIPDLSVDEVEELMKACNFPQADGGVEELYPADLRLEESSRQGDKLEEPPSENNSRPQTREGQPTISYNTSSAQSTRFTSSCPKPETRATSWGTEEMGSSFDHAAGFGKGVHTQPAEETKHEIRVRDGGLSTPASTPCGERKQPRAVTISFSSPLVSHIVYQDDPSIAEPDRHQTPVELRGCSGQGSTSCFRSSSQSEGESSRRPAHYTPFRVASRRSSSEPRVFKGRPVSRIEERSEDSTSDSNVVQGGIHPVVSAPENEEGAVMLALNPNADTSYSFHLSPLAAFSFNQVDETMQLEVNYVAQRTHSKSLRQIHGTFALAAEDLIKHLTDAEPYEIFWDHLRQLDLRDKGLITLHRLNEYCCRLEELNVSDNSIGQLGGVPSSVRTLRIQRNCLSNLTAWGHLSNLQYLDVSGNDLENLDCFSGLIHLRSLKANDNRIKKLDGIFALNGLLSLKMRNNLLSSVDFAGAELSRLGDLDLSGNRISTVLNIDSLRAIEMVDFRNNQIRSLISTEPLPYLHTLKLSNNNIEVLDVTSLPALRLIYLDNNHLSKVTGLDACRHLDTLSLREQTAPASGRPVDHSHTIHIDLSTASTLRKIYLSSNSLSPCILSPATAILSLEFMDLASCALEALPVGFGSAFPNLKVLNLNFNALSDVCQLDGIMRLGRLSLVGNRISRLKSFCQILRAVGGRDGSLTKVDLRGNPITVGFYAPPVSGSARLAVGNFRQEIDQRRRDKNKRIGEHEGDLELANLGGCVDIACRGSGEVGRNDNDGKRDVQIEIDDPYTIPPADVAVDQKYLVRLDEATRLRRRVVELMVQASTAGRLRAFDGLFLEGGGGGRVRKDKTWKKLEELGVLKRRDRENVGGGLCG